MFVFDRWLMSWCSCSPPARWLIMYRRNIIFLMREALMWTINDFPAYEMVFGWITHGKLACPYCMENIKAFTLTNRGKTFFFTATSVSYQRITSTERTTMIFLLAKLKRMLHSRVFLVKNYMTWCHSTVTLCLVSNLVSWSFLVLVWPTTG
jgi:hypothetical protein